MARFFVLYRHSQFKDNPYADFLYFSYANSIAFQVMQKKPVAFENG
jgi:hypothetical protein